MQKANTYLSDIATGQEAIITKVLGHGAFRKRITEMGFVKGKKVRVIKNAPLQDPVEYEIMGYYVSLRRTEAELVEVVSVEEAHNLSSIDFNGVIDEEKLKITAIKKGKVINVALVGNPNCTRNKIGDAVEDFMKKHNIKLSRKEMDDLVDDISDAAPAQE